MTIVFLCSGLEPGRDGVGDQTRRLAIELVRRGLEVQLVALNDRWISSSSSSEADGLAVLRLPGVLSVAERAHTVENLLDRIRPDWTSIQYVCYGLQQKGLPLRWHGAFPRMLKHSGSRHLMFHELWIGESRGAPVKLRVMGWMQKQLIRHLVRRLSPWAVHTSNESYVRLLARNGIAAGVLPLFGNIPFISANLPELFALLQRFHLDLRPETRHHHWLGVMFGSLHPEWQAEPLLPMIRRAAEKQGKQVTLVTVGRIGEAGKTVWAATVVKYADTVTFADLGEQPERVVSALFQVADFGIATSPPDLIGKSSSAISMVEHGLPVVVSRTDADSLRETFDPRFLYPGDPEWPRDLEAGWRRSAPADGVQTTGTALLETFRAAGNI